MKTPYLLAAVFGLAALVGCGLFGISLFAPPAPTRIPALDTIPPDKLLPQAVPPDREDAALATAYLAITQTPTPLPVLPLPETAIIEPTTVPTKTAASLLPVLPPVDPGLITHGRRDLPYLALTFDACETPGDPAGYDQAIIDILIRTNTPATLFLGGLWMQSHPEETRALGSNPLFEIGSHSWSHPDFASISPEQISAEITQTQEIAYRLAGRLPVLLRLPFGTYNDQALSIIAQHGLKTIQWEVVTGDPDPNIFAEDILRAVTSEAQNGSIIIMHMNGRGWHTAEALPEVIRQMQARGFTFVTVSQLLGE